MALNRMIDLLERVVKQSGSGIGPTHQRRDLEVGEDKTLERFQKFAPPKFMGGPNPEIAKNWLEAMVNIFEALKYPENRQVTFSVFQFEGPARSWWNMVKTKWERKQIPWTWTNFAYEFKEKYIPPLVRQKREDEFIRLQQGTSSVAEYET